MLPIDLSLNNVSSGYLLMESAHLVYLDPHKKLKTVTCTPYDLTNLEDIMPVLVDISGLGSGQRQEIGEILELQRLRMTPPTVCAILISDVEIEKIAKQIGKFLSAVDEEGLSVYWRFFDPRVFSLTWTIFSAEQRSVLLGSIREWNFLWHGYWWSARQPPGENDWSLRIYMGFPTKYQWPTMKLSRVLDQVLLKIQNDFQLSGNDFVNLQKKSIPLLIEAVEKINMQNVDELIDYVFMGMKYATSFTSHPELIAAIEEISSGRLRWFSFKKTMNYGRLQELEKSNISIRGVSDG